jgi:histidyl-tRNA synthetase
VGVSIGMERLLWAAGESAMQGTPGPDVCVIALTPDAAIEAQRLARMLRGQDESPEERGSLRVMVDVAGKSSSAQMKWASKLMARWAVFVPRAADGYAIRDMAAGKDGPKQPTEKDLRRHILGLRDSMAAPR